MRDTPPPLEQSQTLLIHSKAGQVRAQRKNRRQLSGIVVHGVLITGATLMIIP